MIENNKIPNHIVIIPDGNRRWAKSKNMKPWDGHIAGAERIEELAKKALEMGVKNVSFWGSSLNNLTKRPLREKQALLRIYEKYFKKLISNEDIYKNETRINIIGCWREQFPRGLKKILNDGIKKTKHYKKTTLNFFLAYNGDDEMVKAIKKIVGKIDKSRKVTKETIKNNLMTKDLPVVDFMIRTGGEPHLSTGFMMWDTANSQLYFSEKLFPDFGGEELSEAIKDYMKRGQRNGK